jgi:hypothetical protein
MRAMIRRFSTSIRVKATWDAVSRPHYLIGVLTAAEQALREGVSEICVLEFGVAGGNGLLALEEYAATVERETGVRITVYGFDTGKGLPELSGDYRDYPDLLRPGDYPMNEKALKERLSNRTALLIGDVVQTVPEFVRNIQRSPIGFVAVDVDFYSSTRDALQIFLLSGKRMLRRVPMYFDDIHFFSCSKFVGELLAIQEFNIASDTVKIDRWRGIEEGRPFPESPWLKKMFIAHDFDAISKIKLSRPPVRYLQLDQVQ